MQLNSVLIIEDDEELRRQIAAGFEAAGYEVRTAEDGLIGLNAFKAAPTDLVVTDIYMPNREGVETIIALREVSASVKIIAVSGGFRVAPNTILNVARGVGADATLAKPFRRALLIELAADLLNLQPASAAA
jgi:DNA-binding response OmpR family regulator